MIVAGGIGLAPLRGAIEELVAARARELGRVFVLVGAREPSQLVFFDDLAAWERAGVAVSSSTVDRPRPSGVVASDSSRRCSLTRASTRSTAGLTLRAGDHDALFGSRVGGPRRRSRARIWVSLERNMQCGLGWCGHCQLGPLLLCRDGPVCATAGRWLRIDERA